MILSLPQRRLIFTNADDGHAERVLAILGLRDCFEAIIDVRATDFTPKPEEEAYQRALALAGGVPATQSVLLDDSGPNLATAQRLGFTTVHVAVNGGPHCNLHSESPGGPMNSPHPAATYTVTDLLDLPRVMPELWEEG
jgi:FMN phosphatase YigB (HAD superfamily)